MHCYAQQEQINLSGLWSFTLDSTTFKSEIKLPGSTDEAGIGVRHVSGTKSGTVLDKMYKKGDLLTIKLLRQRIP